MYVRAMQNSFESENIKTLHRLVGGRVEALEFNVAPGLPFIGVPLKDLTLRKGLLVAGIVRRSGQTVIPSGNDALQEGDDVVIVTTDPGASPETVEAEITKPMEQSMATLDQIKEVTSTSQNSVSMVMLEFEDGVNMDTISVDIQQKISVLQGQWDDTVGAPYVLKINPSVLPVMVACRF